MVWRESVAVGGNASIALNDSGNASWLPGREKQESHVLAFRGELKQRESITLIYA